MRVKGLFSLQIIRLISKVVYPLLNYSIQGKEILDQQVPNKIIVTKKLGLIDLLILIREFDINPLFLENEFIIKKNKLLFKEIKKNSGSRDTLIITIESFQGQYFLNVNQYAYPAYIARKLKAKLVTVVINNHFEGINSNQKRGFLIGKLFPLKNIEVNLPNPLEITTGLNKQAIRFKNALYIYNIASDLIYKSKNIDQTIFDAVQEAALTHGMSHNILEDLTGGTLNYQKTLVSIRLLASKIHKLKLARKNIGIMLPNSSGAAITFLSIISSGKTSAMINFTSGQYNIINSCLAANINEIITSKQFINAVNLEPLVEAIGSRINFIYLEDIKSTISFYEKLIAFLFKRYSIINLNSNDCAAIIFTSGSEGKPKGVALSHKNILSNAAQISARIHFDHNDIVMNVLPIFHCFGLNIGLILPLISGVKVFLYPSPLHYKIIPELIKKSRASIFFGTDTFLSSYAKVSKPEHYKNIRYVLAGAEKLRSNTKITWKNNFNIDILEGYGVTETSPVISLNTPTFNKNASAGILLPHIEFLKKNIDGVQDGGQLYVKGPNVMLGYIHSDKPEVIQPPENGWHDTGDIVEIDDENFISIKGRVKRFAKIGGEMISLATIDGFASDLWPDATSVAGAKFDLKKGQKIILITNCKKAKLEDFKALIKSSGLTEIYFPSQLMILDEIPLLGSGKVDYPKIQELIND